MGFQEGRAPPVVLLAKSSPSAATLGGARPPGTTRSCWAAAADSLRAARTLRSAMQALEARGSYERRREKKGADRFRRPLYRSIMDLYIDLYIGLV